jgi:RNA polymerase primary sigma factor
VRLVHALLDAGEPLLTAADERTLAWRMEAGTIARERRLSGAAFEEATEEELLILECEGELARTRFVAANLRLVALVLREYGIRGPATESDLFQEGCVALALAVLRFDHARGGARFATYALCWIRAYVGAAVAGQLGAMNLPASRVAQLRTARRVESQLAQTLGRLPTTEELAAALGRPVEWTSRLMDHRRPESLDTLVSDPLQDPDQQALTDRPPRRLSLDLLHHLDGLDRRVLEHRFGFVDGRPHSYADVARALRISASRARRCEQRALEALRTICPQSAYAHL